MNFIEVCRAQSWWNTRFMWGVEAYRAMVEELWTRYVGGSSVKYMELEELIG